MKQHFIQNVSTSPTIVYDNMARSFNEQGFQTMFEALPSGCRLKLTKTGFVRTATGLATCVDVDIIPSNGGILVTYAPSIFRQNAAATIISMFFLWPILVTQIIGWIDRSDLDTRIFAEAEKAAHYPFGTLIA